RLLANMAYTNRIRHFKTHAPSAYWQAKLFELAGRIQLKRRVSLLQSEFVKVPLVVGFLKPVILFPFTLMSRLPPEQVEAVLLHELAHIKRKDYLVNLVQSFAEIFFFFNPGVLWISSLIRDERENCCDDIAIRETKSKNEFLHALVSFQEYSMDAPKYALAFPGKKNHLLNRVKRIITNDNKTLNNMEKISLTAGIVIIGLITIASRQSTKQNMVEAGPFSKTFQTKQIIADTVPDKAEKKESFSKFTFKGTIDGKRYEFHEIDDKVKELYVDGKKVPDDKIDDYQDVISKMHIASKEQQEQQQKLIEQNMLLEKQRAELIEQEERMKNDQNELRERQSKEYEEAMDKFKMEQEELNQKMEELKKEQEEILRKQLYKSDQFEHELSDKQNKELFERVLDLKKKQFELIEQSKMEQKMDMKREGELLMRKQIDLKVQEMMLQNEQQSINKLLFDHNFQHDLVSPQFHQFLMENGTVSAIIDELIDEKIITDRGDLSITLNGAILKVNGVIQPEQLHGRFKLKYINGNSKNHVIYSKHGESTSADIIINNK
ncbi:MAG TPA: M56 family metallopeptidase, partial [Puia sp.]|nr:M56 family metallopeptidase [Puia sp.]